MTSMISVNDGLPEVNKEVLLYVAYRDAENLREELGCKFLPKFYVGRLREKKVGEDPNGKNNFWGIPMEGSEWSIDGWSYFFVPEVLYWCDLPEVSWEAV